jgi:hypothetical protein
MRLFKLQAPVLALILSIFAEAVFLLVYWMFALICDGHFTELQEDYLAFYVWFHALFVYDLSSAHLWPHQPSSWTLIFMIFKALFQWWLIFLAAIFIVRYFRRRHDPAA